MNLSAWPFDLQFSHPRIRLDNHARRISRGANFRRRLDRIHPGKLNLPATGNRSLEDRSDFLADAPHRESYRISAGLRLNRTRSLAAVGEFVDPERHVVGEIIIG